MKTRNWNMIAVVVVVGIGALSANAVSQECCAADRSAVERATCCTVADATASIPACCAPATVEKTASVPWLPDTLRNALDPITGETTVPEHFVEYADPDAGVFGRIYFSGKASRDAARTANRKELYEKAFLVREDGTFATYGTARLALDNTFCPVSGVGNTGGRDLKLDPRMAAHCTAGGCSLGNGFKANFNAVEIGACCLSCVKMLVAIPEKFLPNLEPEIEAALAAARGAASEEGES